MANQQTLDCVDTGTGRHSERLNSEESRDIVHPAYTHHKTWMKPYTWSSCVSEPWLNAYLVDSKCV